MTYEDFISRFEKKTPSKNGFTVRCPAHEDGTASLSVGRSKDGGVILKCFAGCAASDVTAALGLELKDLFAKETARPFTPPPAVHRNGESKPKVKAEIETTYSYTDELGRELYQAVRMKPKDFRQRHKVDGQWVWSMAGVELVLYGLAAVLAATQVWICEGEKDCDNLIMLGFCATTNVGGAGKWLDGYTASLKGKHIVLCGDNDDAGRKHVEKVFESIATKAASVKIVKLPTIYKDVSDLIAERKDKAKEMLIELESVAVPHIGGLRMPVYGMGNIEPRYINSAKTMTTTFDLSKWLPSLRYRVRPLPPGSLVLIVGGTGAGKTMVLQNIAMAALDLKTLFFELELSEEELFERFMAIKNKCECAEVEIEYQNNPPIGYEGMMRAFPNLFICPEPRLTIEQMEAIILRAELKMGGKPLLVLIDYVQLVHGEGKSRYEKVSNIAEALKSMAKATKTIVIVASQVDRASAKEGEIGLHSGKDSGSLENSAGLVLCAVRDEKDPTLMRIRILKSTKGHAGYEVMCNMDGAKATITERSGRVML